MQKKDIHAHRGLSLNISAVLCSRVLQSMEDLYMDVSQHKRATKWDRIRTRVRLTFKVQNLGYISQSCFPKELASTHNKGVEGNGIRYWSKHMQGDVGNRPLVIRGYLPIVCIMPSAVQWIMHGPVGGRLAVGSTTILSVPSTSDKLPNSSTCPHDHSYQFRV
ncbi:hypothetical protein C8R43DRAFT_183848 [Mycena crocata]|nr:hypothetical protein C8R43DRAFT_183848 [Mycena crocata]